MHNLFNVLLQRLGLAATGILAHVSKASGYGSVNDLLKTNPAASALHKEEKASHFHQLAGNMFQPH